ASDQTRLSLSPGHRIVYLFKQVGEAPIHTWRVPRPLQGVRAVIPKVLRRLFKTKNTSVGPGGGSKCAKCVHDRIKHAFLIKVQKIIVQLQKAPSQRQEA
ncbi:hypothetical protein PANDA_001431, partial [Ailuropoda melanoleuca]